MMSNPREEWQLDTHRLGRRVLVFDRLASTNDHAAGMAHDPSHDGIVVLADEQSAGRGQHGRSWHSPAGQGVWLSVLLFPPLALRRPVFMAAWAAVAVCQTIGRCTGLPATIKWPNDVLIHGRKVCGILIEQAHATVVGIGLNVNQAAEAFTSAGLPDACSLALFAPPLDTPAVARELITQLDAGYDRLCAGDRSTLEACWKERTGLLGKRVVVECHDTSHEGRLLDLTWDEVILELPRGRRLALRPEAVRHITAISEDKGIE